MELNSMNNTFHSESDCDSESFDFSFFSSSSSFLSSSSSLLSEGDLWSDTSFSFSSEEDLGNKFDTIEPLNQNNPYIADQNQDNETNRLSIEKDNLTIQGPSTESQSNLNPISQENANESSESEVGEDLDALNSVDPFCDICGEVFGSQATLDVHKLNHLISETYVCEICQHISKNREDYSLHFRVHDQNSLPFGVNANKNKNLNNLSYKCSLCDKTFCFASSYKRHMERHTLSHTCNVCNEIFPSKLLCHQHKLTHFKKKLHTCEECGKVFQRSHQLTIHMQVHADNEAKYHCEECGAVYCYKTSLMRHTLKYHSPDSQKFQCDTCGELFKTKKMLNGHAILHTAKRLISCSECSQTFKYRSSYHRHRVIHQGSKPFKCNNCGHFFESPELLKKHKAHHVANDEFVCLICDKSFAFQSFLDQHILVHKDKIESDTID